MSDCVTLYFMHHGRSVADDENVHGGRYDDSLTAAGRPQMRATRALQNAVRRGPGRHLVVPHLPKSAIDE